MTLDVKAIKKRYEAATEGPWECFQSYLNVISIYFGDPPREVCSYVTDAVSNKFPVRVRRNMLFIAHARKDLPDCIAEIERLQEKLRLSELALLKQISYSGSTKGDCGNCGAESVELYDVIEGELCWDCVRKALEGN